MAMKAEFDDKSPYHGDLLRKLVDLNRIPVVQPMRSENQAEIVPHTANEVVLGNCQNEDPNKSLNQVQSDSMEIQDKMEARIEKEGNEQSAMVVESVETKEVISPENANKELLAFAAMSNSDKELHAMLAKGSSLNEIHPNDYAILLAIAKHFISKYEKENGPVHNAIALQKFYLSHPNAPFIYNILQHELKAQREAILKNLVKPNESLQQPAFPQPVNPQPVNHMAPPLLKENSPEYIRLSHTSDQELALEIIKLCEQVYRLKIVHELAGMQLLRLYRAHGILFLKSALLEITRLPTMPEGIIRMPYQPKPLYLKKSHDYKAKVQNSQAPFPNFKINAAAIKVLRKLLQQLKDLDKSGFFYFPVDRKAYPHYYTVIAEPMSLSLMGQRLNLYSDFTQFYSDLQLIIQNCHFYNAPESEIYNIATQFWRVAHALAISVGRQLEAEHGRTEPDLKALAAITAKPKQVIRQKAVEVAKVAEKAKENISVEVGNKLAGWDNIQINSFETIENYIFAIDSEGVKKKLFSNRQVRCSGESCNKIENLGPFDSSISDTGGFKSLCEDRRECVECSNNCGCDQNQCLNRSISLNQRKQLGIDVVKRITYGIDSYTRHVLVKSMPPNVTEIQAENFISTKLMPQINQHNPNNLTKFPVANMVMVLRSIESRATKLNDNITREISRFLLEQMLKSYMAKEVGKKLLVDEWPIYPKGMGVVCMQKTGIKANELISEYFGEVYPPWRWFEREDAIKQYVKKPDRQDDFYNIMLERHRDDEAGYDVLFVDPIRKGNFASRMSHSCEPNCSTVVMSANGKYVIAMYAIKDIGFSEELTFDYNSVTENDEEYKSSICLCGTKHCRGAFMSLVGADAFEQIITREHTFLHRTNLLLMASITPLDDIDYARLESYSFRSSILNGLPSWCLKYASLLIDFISKEKGWLADVLMEESEKNKDEVVNSLSYESAEIEAKGVFYNRLQNLAIDRVKYILRQPNQLQHPPFVLLSDSTVIKLLWNNADSVVAKFLALVKCHLSIDQLSKLNEIVKTPIVDSSECLEQLKSNLILLRDFCRSLTPTPNALHHAAADLFHLYANTKVWFEPNTYASFRSPPFHISELGLQSVPKSVTNPKTIKVLIQDEDEEAAKDVDASVDLHDFGRGKRRKGNPGPISNEKEQTSEKQTDSSISVGNIVNLPTSGDLGKSDSTVASPSLEIDLSKTSNNSASDLNHKSSETNVDVLTKAASVEVDKVNKTRGDSNVEETVAETSVPDIENAQDDVVNSSKSVLPEGYCESRLYSPHYIWAALSFWYKQTLLQPVTDLTTARKGCTLLPTFECCYAKYRTSLGKSYTNENRDNFLNSLSENPSNVWNEGPWSWPTKTANFKLYGSPMLDALRTDDWNSFNDMIAEMRSWEIVYPTSKK